VKPRNIAVIALSAWSPGPLTIMLRFLYHALHERGSAVTLITNQEIDFSHPQLNKVLVNLGKPTFVKKLWFMFSTAKYHVEKLNPDFVVSFDYCIRLKGDTYQFCYLQNAICLLDILSVIRISIFNPRYLYYKFFYPIIAVMFADRNRSIIICQQHGMAKYFRNLGLKVRRIPPMASKVISAVNASPLELPEDLEKVFFYPTSLLPHKNVGLIIRAFRKTRSHNWALLLTGELGSEFYTRLLIYMRGSDQRIEFIGTLRNFEVLQIMNDPRTVLLFPSLIESWGLPLQEARQMGIRILCSDFPYAHETLGDYANVIYLPNKVSAWVNAIEGNGV
jgi:glycosyltransferase involved in cell wall biosynthesis